MAVCIGRLPTRVLQSIWNLTKFVFVFYGFSSVFVYRLLHLPWPPRICVYSGCPRSTIAIVRRTVFNRCKSSALFPPGKLLRFFRYFGFFFFIHTYQWESRRYSLRFLCALKGRNVILRKTRYLRFGVVRVCCARTNIVRAAVFVECISEALKETCACAFTIHGFTCLFSRRETRRLRQRRW